MKKERFDNFMNAIDPAYLEEAQAVSPAKKGTEKAIKKTDRKIWIRRMVAAAACVCLVAAGISLWPSDQSGTEHAGMVSATLEELQAKGFSFLLPDEAQAAAYAIDEAGNLAQAEFTVDGSTYVCKAVRGDAAVPEDEAGRWISWYAEEEGVQYVLTGNEETGLKTTARLIMENMGLNVNVDPKNAENVLYYTLDVEGAAGELLQAAAVSFELDGIRYDYRTAPTGMFEVQDLSGTAGEAYENQSQAELGWCMADLYWNQDGSGKILWLDFAPGLLYSLAVENGATEEALLETAEGLFVPAQDDVG